jgi:hypothetical protein
MTEWPWICAFWLRRSGKAQHHYAVRLRSSQVPMFAPYFCMGNHVPMPLYKMACVFHSYRIGREFNITILVPVQYRSLISVELHQRPLAPCPGGDVLTDTYHELDGTFCSTSDASEKQPRQHHLEGIIRAVPSAPRIMVGSILK